MKARQLAICALSACLLGVGATSDAREQNTFCRQLGYGVSDGYHAPRCAHCPPCGDMATPVGMTCPNPVQKGAYPLVHPSSGLYSPSLDPAYHVGYRGAVAPVYRRVFPTPVYPSYQTFVPVLPSSGFMPPAELPTYTPVSFP